MMENRTCGSLMTALITSCLAAVTATSALAGENRAAWGTGPIRAGMALDDNALTQVSARGSIDENAIRALQTNGKLVEHSTPGDVLSAALLSGALGATESAEKQAVQTQLKMAINASQSLGNAIQVAIPPNPATAPIPFVPDLAAPLFGLAELGARVANGAR